MTKPRCTYAAKETWIYQGTFDQGEYFVSYGQNKNRLPMAIEHRRWSVDFEWGAGDTDGARQLAIAMLVHALEGTRPDGAAEQMAKQSYALFTREMVARFAPRWHYTRDDLLDWMHTLEHDPSRLQESIELDLWWHEVAACDLKMRA